MSKNKESSKCKPGLIGWNELATSDVPNVGRICVLTDPQGGVIGIIKPKM